MKNKTLLSFCLVLTIAFLLPMNVFAILPGGCIIDGDDIMAALLEEIRTMLFRLLLTALLTVLIEGLFFLLTSFKEKSLILLSIPVNLATNIALNLSASVFSSLIGSDWTPFLAIPLEILVVLAEYLIYQKVSAPGRKLFLKTLAANLLSFGTGLLLSLLLKG